MSEKVMSIIGGGIFGAFVGLVACGVAFAVGAGTNACYFILGICVAVGACKDWAGKP